MRLELAMWAGAGVEHSVVVTHRADGQVDGQSCLAPKLQQPHDTSCLVSFPVALIKHS